VITDQRSQEAAFFELVMNLASELMQVQLIGNVAAPPARYRASGQIRRPAAVYSTQYKYVLGTGRTVSVDGGDWGSGRTLKDDG
jgi:hypothetical protein